MKVLTLTVHEDRGDIRQLLTVGVVGYVRRADPEELIHAPCGGRRNLPGPSPGE